MTVLGTVLRLDAVTVKTALPPSLIMVGEAERLTVGIAGVGVGVGKGVAVGVGVAVGLGVGVGVGVACGAP